MKKRTPLFTLSALAIAAPAATAGLGQDPIQFTSDAADWVAGQGPVTLTLDPFDGMGGTRELVAIDLWCSIVIDTDGGLIENGSDVAVEPEDYSFDFFINHSTEWDNGLPLGGLGASSAPTPSVPLAASDGVDSSGPDTFHYTWGLKELDIFAQIAIVEQDFFRFEGNAPISFDVLPVIFPSAVFPPPVLDFTLLNHREFIEYGIGYRYREVPAPASSIAILGAGALSFRRRRN